MNTNLFQKIFSINEPNTVQFINFDKKYYIVEITDEKNIILTLKDKDLKRTIESQLKIGFKIKQNRQDIKLFYEGFELFEDGTCSFYLRSDKLVPSECTLFFGLFMDIYTEQQNKLNYKKENDQVVYNYFVFKRENTIEL